MTKREQAYNQLRDDIFFRNLLPGSKVNISELAEKYNMSAIPIREALTLLENENLVQNVPYRGYVVSSMVFRDFLEYSLISGDLECLALRYGIAYSTEESLANIKAQQKKLTELLAAGEMEQYVVADHDFHLALYSFAPCTTLLRLIPDVKKKSFHSRSVLLLLPDRAKYSTEEHEQLIRAIEQKDTELAVHLLFVHRLHTLTALVHEMKYSLMKPNYRQEDVLTTFFSESQLEDRNAISGEVECWNYILEHLTNQ